MLESNADMGIAVDPDVDRLVFMCENGELFGEENTLVACSDYVLSKSLEILFQIYLHHEV